ncbi:MAG: alanine--glyoxylate aminotransferase family protein, partial [Rhodobacterales bacterium]
MTLSNGRPYLAIPGPSVVPDQVLQAMHRPSPDIYEGALFDLTHSLVPDLRSVARTQGDVAMYISNGHGVWEAALSNVVAAKERVLC